MPNDTIIDLDAVLAAKMQAAKDRITYKEVRILGSTWRISNSPNAYTALGAASGDLGALTHMIAGAVHPDERDAFTKALRDAEGIDDQVLLALIEGILEVVGERPTESSSDSSDGTTSKKVAKPKSEDD
jgi:hypothetical protein